MRGPPPQATRRSAYLLILKCPTTSPECSSRPPTRSPPSKLLRRMILGDKTGGGLESQGDGRCRDGRVWFCINEERLADWIKLLITDFMSRLGVRNWGGGYHFGWAGIFVLNWQAQYEEYMEDNMSRRCSIMIPRTATVRCFNWKPIPEKDASHPFWLQCIP